MFSKMARSMLRGIRVATKQELVDRIHLYYRWKFRMDETSIAWISTE
jgi:hypothetical protein